MAATVGRDDAQPARWYVRRVHAVSSQFTSGSADHLDPVDRRRFARRARLHADNFNAPSGDVGPHQRRQHPPRSVWARWRRRRQASTLFLNAGVNSAGNTGATTYIVRNDTAPHNTPSNAYFDATGNATP